MRLRDFRLLIGASLAMQLAGSMIEVAIGWQVYDIHRSALDLGLVGLAAFLPLPLLALPAGHLADRFSRKLVYGLAVGLELAVAVSLIVVTSLGATQLWAFLALAATNGVAAALGNPAGRAMPPALVPPELLSSAFAVRSVVMRGAGIVGPALGGFLFAVGGEIAYGVAAGLFTVALVQLAALRPQAVAQGAAGAPTLRLENLLAGIRLIRRTPILLGAITLDLFAVLFGDAIALLPLFAATILEVGPVGLGVLRSAPAIGGLLAAGILIARPIGPYAGRKLLAIIASFGACMIVFGLSRNFALSFGALAASGFVDMFSVNIRQMIVALAAPDELRGRVMAVEMVFISASNELGAFEAGAAAAVLGAVPAVVAGGVFMIVLAAAGVRLFPALARIHHLEEIRPAPV